MEGKLVGRNVVRVKEPHQGGDEVLVVGGHHAHGLGLLQQAVHPVGQVKQVST
jgi:hypothetical protein